MLTGSLYIGSQPRPCHELIKSSDARPIDDPLNAGAHDQEDGFRCYLVQNYAQLDHELNYFALLALDWYR